MILRTTPTVRRATACQSALLLLFLQIGVALSNPVPVFQHALEYGENPSFEVEVRHDGPLTSKQRAVVALLEKTGTDETLPANVNVRWRDYSQAQVAAPEGVDLPYISVSYPTLTGIRRAFWTAPLEDEAVRKLLRSPMRQKIAEELLDRNAAVWVFLESGNESADQQGRATLEAELERMEDSLTVPDPGNGDWGEIIREVSFTVLTLDREDPDEQVLVRMLMGSERDLEQFTDLPVVFPVFGRGLVLPALVGDGINENTLKSVGGFLAGPCATCQLEGEHRGINLLLSLDWDEKVQRLSTFEPDGSYAGRSGSRREH